MPTVPEPLPPPKSLGGLLNFTEESDGEETTMPSLIERASETTEDIQERREVSDAIDSIEEELEQLEATDQIEEEV